MIQTMIQTMRRRGLGIAVGLALPLVPLLAGACRWAVPADPGLNARLRQKPPVFVRTLGTDAQVLEDDGARELYLEKCGRCHAPFAPTALDAARWPAMVLRYGPRAGLFGADRERVQRWLVAHARR